MKAAQALNLTQPAVTTRIRNLEEALGAELFDRSANRMRVTKRGGLLVKYAEQVEQLSELVAKDVMDPAGIEGHLRIGVSETIAQCWLPDLVSQIHASYPRVEIEINVDISIHLRQAILDKDIDLAILLGPISEFSVENLQLPAFELAWYCSPEQPGDSTAESALFNKPIITYARNTRPFRELKVELIERLGPGIPMFPSSSLSACFRLVEAGLGVAALPRAMGRRLTSEGRLREFDPGWVPNPLQFTVSYLGEPKSQMVEAVGRIAQQVAHEFHSINTLYKK